MATIENSTALAAVNGGNTSLTVLATATESLSDLITAFGIETSLTTTTAAVQTAVNGASAETETTEAIAIGDVVRRAITTVAKGLGEAASANATQLVLTSPRLNITAEARQFTSLSAQPFSCPTPDATPALVQLEPTVLQALEQAEGIEPTGTAPLNSSVVRAVMWTTSSDVHGSAGQGIVLSGPTLSFTLFRDGHELTVSAGNVLMRLPLNKDVSTTESCVGQPTAQRLFERLREGYTKCTTALECRYWEEEQNIWSTRGCQTVEFADGAMGCDCSHLSDFIAVQVDRRYVPNTTRVPAYVNRTSTT